MEDQFLNVLESGVPSNDIPNDLLNGNDESDDTSVSNISFWKKESLKQFIWVLSRVLLVIFLVGITIILRKPVNKFIKKELISNYDKIMTNRENIAITEMNEALLFTSNTTRSLTNIITTIKKKGRNGYVKDIEDLMVIFTKNMLILSNKYYNKSVNWDQKFDDAVFEYLLLLNETHSILKENIENILDNDVIRDRIYSYHELIIRKESVISDIHNDVHNQKSGGKKIADDK